MFGTSQILLVTTYSFDCLTTSKPPSYRNLEVLTRSSPFSSLGSSSSEYGQWQSKDNIGPSREYCHNLPVCPADREAWLTMARPSCILHEPMNAVEQTQSSIAGYLRSLSGTPTQFKTLLVRQDCLSPSVASEPTAQHHVIDIAAHHTCFAKRTAPTRYSEETPTTPRYAGHHALP